MKKSFILMSLLLASSSVLVAGEMDNSWFIGGEFGTQNMKVKLTATILGVTDSATDTLDATYEAVKAGKYFEFGRVYGSLSKQNEKDDFTSYSFGLGYDYLFKNKSEFTPFVGVNASYTKGKVDTEDARTLSLDKPKGFNYGLEAGLLYSMAKNMELEFGIRYMISNVDDTFNMTTPAISAKLEGENITQYYLGLNYKF